MTGVGMAFLSFVFLLLLAQTGFFTSVTSASFEKSGILQRVMYLTRSPGFPD